MDKPTVLLWDLDTIIRSLVSRSLVTLEMDPVTLTTAFSIVKCKEEFNKIKDKAELKIGTKCEHKFFLSNPEISSFYFRNALDNLYKANRKKASTPVSAERPYWNYIIANIEKVLDIKVTTNIYGLELDDVISIKAEECDIIVSTDKDFALSNIVLNPMDFTIKKPSASNLAYLLLVGDKADDIEGIKGYGDVKAKKLIDVTLEEDLMDSIRELYEANNKDFDRTVDMLMPVTKDKFKYNRKDNTYNLLLNSITLKVDINEMSIEAV